jgi:hypothetical protein
MYRKVLGIPGAFHQKNYQKGKMIKRLNHRNRIDILEFMSRVSDTYQDFYVTIDKNRIFFKDAKTIKKIINKQEIYGIDEGEIKGLLIIYREKGFRPYVKILASDFKYQGKLVKFLIWNFSNQDLYAKFKKFNPLTKILQRYGFIFQGDRGDEILLYRKGEKRIFKVGAKDKDEYDNNETKRPSYR